jgi:aryl sulfotransferase
VSVAWPRKTREVLNFTSDSRRWENVRFRPGDIVIASYGKTGTTWVQQIVAQLIFGGAQHGELRMLSPFVDMHTGSEAALHAHLEAQRHRRFMKTHLPLDALVFSPEARYLYVARDGRDVVWSLYNHHVNATEEWYRITNDAPGRIWPRIERPNASVRDYFREWLERDGFPFAPFWNHVRTWWEHRNVPNIRLCHFANLKADLSKEIRSIAAFLDIEPAAAAWPAIEDHCTFEYMKRTASRSAPSGGIYWKGGARTFINKGTNGRWRDVLQPEDIALYESTAVAQLGPDCAHWLATGQMSPS